MFSRTSVDGTVVVTTTEQEVMSLWSELSSMRDRVEALFEYIKAVQKSLDALEKYFEGSVANNDQLYIVVDELNTNLHKIVERFDQ